MGALKFRSAPLHRIVSVISSCKSEEQLASAHRYVQLSLRLVRGVPAEQISLLHDQLAGAIVSRLGELAQAERPAQVASQSQIMEDTHEPLSTQPTS